MDTTIECAARLVWLSDYSKDDLMTVTHAAYFDASGKREGYAYVSVAGGAAPLKKWIRFERDWQRIMKAAGVSIFHATDFAASRGEYATWKGDKVRRSEFLKALQAVIKANVNRLFMVSVEVDAWNAVNEEYMLQEAFHSPFALAAYSVILQARKWAIKKELRSPLRYVFEDGEDRDDWSGLVKLLTHTPGKITPVRLPKELAIPCQVGDMVAWKNRIAATNSLSKLRAIEAADFPDFENLRGIIKELDSLDNALYSPSPEAGIYSPRALRKTCEDSKVRKRSEKIVTAI